MSTSKLQKRVSELLSTYLGQWTIRENYRPEWLGGLELDFYIEEIEAAIEVQGAQHYEFVEVFHISYDGFRAQLARDRRKQELCTKNGVFLYEVCDVAEAILTIECLAGIKVEYPTHTKALEQERQWREETQLAALVSLGSSKPIRGWIKKLRNARRRIAVSRMETNVSGFLKCIKKRKDAIRRYLIGKRYDSTLVEAIIDRL